MLNTMIARFRNRNLAELGRLAVLNARHALRSLTPSARMQRRADLEFDLRWGTDTSAGVSVRELGFDISKAYEYRRYDPSGEWMVRDPVAALGLDPANYDFIDYGAGKGRVMMLAMEMQFLSVAGIELSDRLCEVARSNIARFAERSGIATTARVLNADATAIAPEGRHILAYFYNPFGATIMAAVRQQLEEALRESAESVTVIYSNPEHADVFAAAPGWRVGPGKAGIATFQADAKDFRA